ncbi:MAG: hypothetical protein ABSG68_08025 [Thermoguttaceae bacterium]|jgi:tetratricopeptide (TPR) repeat protein
MDRDIRYLCRRLALPLAVLALASLPWLVFRPGTSVPSQEPPPIRVTVVEPARAETIGAAPNRLPDLKPAVRSGVAFAGLAAIGNAGSLRQCAADAAAVASAGPELAMPAPALAKPVAPSTQTTGKPAAPAQAAERKSGQAPTDLPTAAAGQSRPPAALLAPDAPPTPRSDHLENIARLADRQLLHGFELANREALFAARAEFIAALRLVSQGLDDETQTTLHSSALSAGLTALKEAQDFIPAGAKLEADLDLATIVAGHRTPVLKSVPASGLRPISALKAYFTFAQAQLAAAGGHEVAGSIALYALGKLHATFARQKALEVPAAEPKAMVCFQASLLVYPRNFMSANDLGVLLAQCGNFSDARTILQYSVSLSRTSVALGNLANVYQQLGDARLAQQTLQQAGLARNAEAARMKAGQRSADGIVAWVDSATFARATGDGSLGPPPAAAPTVAASGQTAAVAPGSRTAPAGNNAPAPAATKSPISWHSWFSDDPSTTR